MEIKSYFTLSEWVIIILLAVVSALLNTYIPIKSIIEYFGISGPAAGMALFGGFIFVLWISLACLIIKKKSSGIITSIFIASFCLLIHPWYGIVSPMWFSIYGIVGLLSMGILIEFTDSRSFWLAMLGGGLGNVTCLVITWLAIGIHTDTWIPLEFGLLLMLAALISGSAGILLAYGINKRLDLYSHFWQLEKE
ncbi:MAG: hypothetical protein JRJ57_02040 [Deltaproteobacteria bacterium]|nr:hypothetical protein [Deltaproteobacteria bacterium]